MKSKLRDLIEKSLKEIEKKFGCEIPADFIFDIEVPQIKEHGDISCNIAFKLSRVFKEKPLSVAEKIKPVIMECAAKDRELSSNIKEIRAEKPGFLNFFIKPALVMQVLREIEREGLKFGRSNFGKGKKILIEFVSANPTGPLTIAHGRQACVGDALSRICEEAGFRVTKEYYLNDVGRQITLLGESVKARYLEMLGQESAIPEDGYKGEYIKGIAKGFLDKNGDGFASKDDEESLRVFSEFAVENIMRTISEDLKMIGVEFDSFFSEAQLRGKGKIEKALEFLSKKELLYEKEGALWFKSSEFGDDKDRVLRKSDGLYTYLAPDIAYHREKFERGNDQLINLWGPDHHGYIARIKAACKALGFDESRLHVLIIQLTTLYRKGEPARMSTRAGEFITLRELMDEAGADATRFFFLMRKTDSQLDFDIDLAKQKSQDNPVYYLQYAHARISSITEFAEDKVEKCSAELELLHADEEISLAKHLSFFPEILIQAAEHYEPYRLVDYLRELAAYFHKFYNLHRVVSDDAELTNARLLLVDCVRIVLKNGLRILGISQPEKM